MQYFCFQILILFCLKDFYFVFLIIVVFASVSGFVYSSQSAVASEKMAGLRNSPISPIVLIPPRIAIRLARKLRTVVDPTSLGFR